MNAPPRAATLPVPSPAEAPTPAATVSTPPAPTGMPDRRTVAGFFVMVFGMFMAILDIQIVASSLAEIRAGLNASATEVSWVQTSYLIAEVIMIPLSGWLARLFSTRWLFTLSAVGFTLSSVLCGLAWNLDSMIVFRALQGFIGGAMIPTVFAVAISTFRGPQAARTSIFIGLIVTLAPTLGPTLGGWVTQALSWHWLFFINIVPGIAIAILVPLLVDVDRPEPGLLRQIDLPGLALIAAFLGSLQYVLEEGPRQDWFADRSITLFALVAIVAGVLFIHRGLTHPRRMIDLTAFADRNFAVGCLYSLVIGVGLYGSVYLVPQFLAQTRGVDSLKIGYAMMVVGLAQLISAPLAGALANRLDSRLMLGLGLALFGWSSYLITGLTNQSGFWELFWAQSLRGFSLMFCFLPINQLALGHLQANRLKNASGLYNLMRNLGGALGLALLNTVLQDRYSLHHQRLAEHITPARPEVAETLEGLAARVADTLGPAGADQAALKMIEGMVGREALVMSFNDLFLLIAGVFVLALLFMPLVRRVRFGERGEGAH
jgi:DHA2 family multidrug resistance protein